MIRLDGNEQIVGENTNNKVIVTKFCLYESYAAIIKVTF